MVLARRCNLYEMVLLQAEQLERALKQLSAEKGWRKTVIVHPHLGKDADDAGKLSSDWSSREEKQLAENVEKVLR